MISGRHKHRYWWAFAGHRISGVALAIFLPFHFLLLGTAIDGDVTMDSYLALADNMLAKIAEMGLVFFLTIHLVFGLRVLLIELVSWRPWQKDLIAFGVAMATLMAAGFILIAS
ncbi:succinate dehydrogenase [Alphaproteobacteria bacterium HT1-32]|nr:succinate dehydrogenase [Alphaproteobacteria bacterium HT1-32]